MRVSYSTLVFLENEQDNEASKILDELRIKMSKFRGNQTVACFYREGKLITEYIPYKNKPSQNLTIR